MTSHGCITRPEVPSASMNTSEPSSLKYLTFPDIPGLSLYYEAMSESVEKELLRLIDEKVWSTDLSRRTQQYGYEYSYRNRRQGTKIQDIPTFLHPLLQQLSQSGLGSFQQCIINEYRQKQGISPHTDHPSFGPIIVSYSLAAPSNMIFTSKSQKRTIFLPRRSLLVLQGEARSEWKHSIPTSNTIITGTEGTGSTNNTQETTIIRDSHYRRVSITFRSIPN